MFSKSLLVLLGCFVQGFLLSDPSPRSRWVDNIVEEFKPRIADISSEIKAQISADDIINEEIKDWLRYSQILTIAEIKNAELVLESRVNQTIEETDDPEDIRSCLDAERAAQTNLSKQAYVQLEGCVQASQGQATDLKKETAVHYSNLVKLQNRTDLIIRECTRNFSQQWQQSALRRCLRDRVDDVERKLERQKIVANVIKERAHELLHELATSIKSVLKDLSSNVLSTLEKLNTCVQLSTSKESQSSEEESSTSKDSN